METKSEINENNNVEMNIFPKHHRKQQNAVNFDSLLRDKDASMDHLHQSLIPALQTMYKIPEDNQFMLLQPLLNMYIQNKYFGELLKKSRSVLIEDMENVEQSNVQSENVTIHSIDYCSPPPQDQPLDLSIKTKRSQNDMYHSLSDALNLSSSCNNEVAPIKSKSKRSRFKSPSVPAMNIENLNNHQVPSSSSNESDQDYNNSMQVFVKQEYAVFSCHICGQGFGIQDRLAKHVASCHKARKKQTDTTKTYECEVCKRSFARSDMLTRHSRLHTGKTNHCSLLKSLSLI